MSDSSWQREGSPPPGSAVGPPSTTSSVGWRDRMNGVIEMNSPSRMALVLGVLGGLLIVSGVLKLLLPTVRHAVGLPVGTLLPIAVGVLTATVAAVIAVLDKRER